MFITLTGDRSAVSAGMSTLQTINGAFLHGDVKDEVINISHFTAEPIFILHRR